jgi:prefoldin subunit 4
VSVSKAQTLLASDQVTLEKDISGLQERLDECTTEMTNLKIVLYAKFGKAINLD